MWAVVPAKDFGNAKQRLAGLLAPGERRGLSRAMLADVLAALSAADGLAGIVVVTGDADAAGLARRHGTRVLADPGDRGQTEAVSRAARMLDAEGDTAMIALPGDVPLVTAAEIADVVRAHATAPAVTLVPDRAGRGTNVVVCSPPRALPLSFGDDSFDRHLAAARGRGIAPRILRLPRLGLDIDRPADLRAFLARPSATRAYAYLVESGIAERLRGPAARAVAS